MSRLLSCAIVSAMLMPASLLAQEITLVDATINHATSATIARALPQGFPADLTTPMDYAGGTLHHKITVSNTAGGMTGYQLCFVQDANRACSDYSALLFNSNVTDTATQALSAFTDIANLDLTMPLTGMEVVLLDMDGNAIADADATYLPVEARYEAILVAAGETFSGFPSDQPANVATPTFSPAAGTYTNSVSVSLSTTTADATIYYTTDGSAPDETSTEYTGSFTITETTTVRARAYAEGLTASSVASATYTIGQATSGLTGRYYNGRNFGSLQHTRVDPVIDFSWEGGENPAPDVNSTFSALWTGTVTPRYSEQFTFQTTSDDGVRLWVDGQLIIDNWQDQGPTSRTGNITLQADQQYEIWMEYYNGGGAGRIELVWSSATQPEEVIPETALNPNAPASPATASLLMSEDFERVAETSSEPIVLEVRRRGNLDSSVRIGLTYSGTAVLGEDFEGPNSVDIAAGALSARIELQPIIDGVVEGEENIVIALDEGQGYTIGSPNQHEITLLDFDINTYTIAGTINYDGFTSGKLYVEAFTDEMQEFEKRRITINDPGPFAILDVEEGDYNVVAFIDTNDNERLDPDEIWTMTENKVTIPPSATDITLTLTDNPVDPDAPANVSGEGSTCSSASSGPGGFLLLLFGLVYFLIFRRECAFLRALPRAR